eukprot:1190514-Prorocentrum_minimum.AAC.1
MSYGWYTSPVLRVQCRCALATVCAGDYQALCWQANAHAVQIVDPTKPDGSTVYSPLQSVTF